MCKKRFEEDGGRWCLADGQNLVLIRILFSNVPEYFKKLTKHSVSSLSLTNCLSRLWISILISLWFFVAPLIWTTPSTQILTIIFFSQEGGRVPFKPPCPLKGRVGLWGGISQGWWDVGGGGGGGPYNLSTSLKSVKCKDLYTLSLSLSLLLWFQINQFVE